MLAPFQQRVVDEKTELDEKIAKLKTFSKTSMFADLPEEERERLWAQLYVMDQYSNILGRRISAFDVT